MSDLPPPSPRPLPPPGPERGDESDTDDIHALPPPTPPAQVPRLRLPAARRAADAAAAEHAPFDAPPLPRPSVSPDLASYAPPDPSPPLTSLPPLTPLAPLTPLPPLTPLAIDPPPFDPSGDASTSSVPAASASASTGPASPTSGPTSGPTGGPTMVVPTVAAATPAPASGELPAPPQQPWWHQRWTIIAIASVVVALIAVAVIVADDDDPTALDGVRTTLAAPPASDDVPVVTQTSTPIGSTDIPPIDTLAPTTTLDAATTTTPGEATTSAETTTPTTVAETVAPPAVVVVGAPISLFDGALVRLNSVTPDAPPLDQFIVPDPGMTLTRLDVEACAGSGPFGSVNPSYWFAELVGGGRAEGFVLGGDVETVTLAPGACARALIDLQTPAGGQVAQVAVLGAALDELGRWTIDGTNVPVDGPLRAVTPVTPRTIGEAAPLAGDGSVVVRSATPAAPPINPDQPAAEGRQIVVIDVEVCAGSGPGFVNPLYWLAAAADNRMGSARFVANTLPSSDLDPGQCASGLVELDMPADAVIQDIVFTNDTLTEIARWRLG